MRILLFGPYPFAGQPLEGGVMAVVHALARGLAVRPDLEVAVAAAHVEAQPTREEEGRLTIYRVPIRRFPRSRVHWLLRRDLQAIAADYRPDLIHGHGSGYNAAAALDAGPPALITLHGVIRQEAMLSGANSWKSRMAWAYDARMEARILRRARHCVAISPYVRRAFAAYDPIIWHDVPNPVDDACFTVERRPQPGRLLSTARIIPRKGIDLLIAAFAQIAADHPQARLHLAGETESSPGYVRQCRAQIEAAGLESRIHLLGNCSRADLLAELAQAQALVLAARQETAPVAVAEALAAGCPVLATRVGGLPDMVEDEGTGLLVPPEDSAALARALDRVLARPDQAEAWGEKARRQGRRYRLDAILERTLHVYRQVIADR